MKNCASNAQAWDALVCLLEEFELNKEKPESQSNGKVVVGAIFLVFGVAGLIVAGVNSSGNIASAGWPIVYFGSMLCMVPGIILVASGLSNKAFVKINRGIQRAVNGWLIFAQVALVVISAGFALVFIYDRYADNNIVGHNLATSSMINYSIVAMIAVAVLIAGMGPIDLGLINPRAGIRAKQASIYIEVASLAVLMIVSVAWVGWSPSGIALAVSLLTALIAYLKYRHSRIDSAFSEALYRFNDIRAAAISDVQDREGESGARFASSIYEKYRKLHLGIASSPEVDRRKYKGFGLTALCQVSDMRVTGELKCEKFITGDARIRAAQRCINLSEYEFAFGTAQLFDALIRMLDGSFVPQAKKKKQTDELRKCLEFHAILASDSTRPEYYLLKERPG